MKAFVINLDKDTKRLKNFNTCFKNSMFNIERINGVYGKDVKDNELSYICKSMCTDSMKGCAASHRYIWNNIVISQRNCFKFSIIAYTYRIFCTIYR